MLPVLPASWFNIVTQHGLRLHVCMLPVHLHPGIVTDSGKCIAAVAVVPTCLKCNVTLVDDSLSAPCEGGKKLVLLQAVVGIAGCGPTGGFPHLLPSRVPKSAQSSTVAGQNRGHCFNGRI